MHQRRLGIRVRIERRLSDRATDRSRPPAGADAFMRIAFARHIVRTVGNASGMRGSRTSRESRARKVERAPPEMRRARFADESPSKFLEHAIGLDENLPAAMRRIRIVRCV